MKKFCILCMFAVAAMTMFVLCSDDGNRLMRCRCIKAPDGKIGAKEDGLIIFGG